MPPQREWVAKRRAWAQSHPGYCPVCGLPSAYCYDQNPAFRQERGRAMRDGVAGITDLIREWHGRVLREMPSEVLETLPVPSSKLRCMMVIEERNRRGLDAKPKPVVRRSAWERLLGEPIV